MGPDYSKPFLLQTDASEIGIGSVLSQLDEQKQDRPVAYVSRKLKRAERNYATVERECSAIVPGIKHFEVYLMGVSFTVVTDHGCLKYLKGGLHHFSRNLQKTCNCHNFFLLSSVQIIIIPACCLLCVL